MSPQRIQMSRQRPWRAEHPDAVIVDRRSKWGNPWKIGKLTKVTGDGPRLATAAEVVEVFRFNATRTPRFVEMVRAELAGKDLACWCPLPAPGEPDICHAAVLLELANDGGTR